MEYYIMYKNEWNPGHGEYSLRSKDTGKLSLRQVRARVARLPETTDWLWTVDKFQEGKPFDSRIGSISADEFKELGDVPTWGEL